MLPAPACRYMLASLQEAAIAAGHPEWGHGGPHDSGNYNSQSFETGFFKSYGGSWDSGAARGQPAGAAHGTSMLACFPACPYLCSQQAATGACPPADPAPPPCPHCPSFLPVAEYGSFFLSWYSGLLIQHADLLLGATKQVLSQRCRPRAMREARELSDGGMLYVFEPAVQLGIKLAGVHWWFKSRTHAAELTAGYYNTRERNGYLPIFEMLKRHSATASFTCVEMRDCEHPTEGRCSPEGLLNQVRGQAQVWCGGGVGAGCSGYWCCSGAGCGWHWPHTQLLIWLPLRMPGPPSCCRC